MAKIASSLPCLVFHHGDDENTTTLYSVADGARLPCEEMEEALRGKRSWVTSRGWLLVWDPATLATFLWDPRTAAKIALPDWASPPAAGTDCALSGDPGGDCCFTVVVLEQFESQEDDTALWYCHAGGGTPSPWTRHEYDLGGSWVTPPDGKLWTKRFVCGLTSCGGKFYWSAGADGCGVLEFTPEPALTVVKMANRVKVVVPPGEHYAQALKYSVDLDGEMHVAWIFTTGDGAEEAVVDVALYRVDLAGKRFVKVDNIGDRAILAGGSSCSSAGWCPAAEFGLLPNSVYWMHPYQSSRMYVYDVGSNEEEVHELGLGDRVLDPSRAPFWIAPSSAAHSSS